MYYDDHAPPHFHAAYAGAEVVVHIPDLALARDALPPRALGLVLEWASQHREELAANWERVESGMRPVGIEPLKWNPFSWDECCGSPGSSHSAATAFACG